MSRFSFFHLWLVSLRRGGRRYALPWFSMRRWRNRVLLMTAALLAGLMCILFALGAEEAIAAHRRWMHRSQWLSLIIAPAGFALVVWFARRFVPATLGSGIPQALAAGMSDDRRVRDRLLSLKIAWAKIMLTLGGLLAGASTGREGPSVQVGASALHLLSGLKRKRRIVSSQDLIAAGGGAGIAAAFNTPLGGILFAIEEMCRFRAFHANSTTLTAVIFAGLTSLGVLGVYNYFGQAATGLDWSNSLWPTLACGICGGLLGGLFSRLLIACSRGLPGRIGQLSSEHPVLFAACCGLGTALVGLATGGLTYGTGYAETRSALEGHTTLPWFFFLAKMAVILLAFLSRLPGGMFAPALAVGAGIGVNIALFFPETSQSALLILGMVAFLAGMTQTPITAFVIVMEMTANHNILIPLMAAAVIAHTISRSICPVPIYHALSYATLRHVNATLAEEDRTAHAARQQAKLLAAPPEGQEAAPEGDKTVAR